MQNEKNKIIPICQSCGMPMVESNHFGINSNGIPSKEYCCFCMNNGKFTDDISLYDFAEKNISYSITNESENLNNGKYERILNEAVKLHTLKRWYSHDTHLYYYASIYKSIEYIKQNISKDIKLEELSEIANISKFHFHRLFKAILNESPHEYIQRIRLEKAAFKLHTTKYSINQIAEQVGYLTAESLAKAFKKKYNLSPREYRKKNSDLTVCLDKPLFNIYVEPIIQYLPEKNLLCFPIKNAFTQTNAYTNAWNSIISYIKKRGLSVSSNNYYCINYDISTHTDPDKCRIYVCIETNDSIKPTGKFSLQTINSGKYAVFNFLGQSSDLETYYCNIYRYWVPKSKFTLRDSLHFEKYIPDSDIESSVIHINIYIPIE